MVSIADCAVLVYGYVMRSTELTREQLERMEREVERHHRYYLKLWRRAQANDTGVMPAAKSTS